MQLLGVTVLVTAMWLGALLMPALEGEDTLTVAVGMWPGAEPLILAREAGELPREKVNLVEINWASAAMRALGNRVVDATVLSLDEAVRQIGQGYQLRIVLVTDISRGADAVIVRQGISDVRQLAGLRVGYEPRTVASVMLDRCLRGGGLALTGIEEVPMNPAETEEIFEELKLDAVVISEPWIQRLRNLHLHTLYDSSMSGAEVMRVLAVHADALERHRDEVKALVRAHLKWMPRLRSLQAELEPILRREGVDRQTFLSIMDKLEVPTREQNLRWLTGENGALLQKMESLAGDVNVVGAEAPAGWMAKVLDPSFVRNEP
ncbi:MAG: ABC transporter substrate-binding protein [Prosthecobacter sp.]|nr:ABC transporter substrate-binding protein [Prosthecobacter sp.]